MIWQLDGTSSVFYNISNISMILVLSELLQMFRLVSKLDLSSQFVRLLCHTMSFQLFFILNYLGKARRRHQKIFISQEETLPLSKNVFSPSGRAAHRVRSRYWSYHHQRDHVMAAALHKFQLTQRPCALKLCNHWSFFYFYFFFQCFFVFCFMSIYLFIYHFFDYT